MDLHINSQVDGKTLKLTLEGNLNEMANFDDLPLSGIEDIHIDFGGLKFINSSGIHRWVKWTQNIENDHAAIRVGFFKCPKIIIDQVNAVKGFLPKSGTIHSFMLPFYCEESDRHEMVLMQRDKDFMEESSEGQEWVKVPNCSCSETQTPCEMDVMPKKYFAFLKRKS